MRRHRSPSSTPVCPTSPEEPEFRGHRLPQALDDRSRRARSAPTAALGRPGAWLWCTNRSRGRSDERRARPCRERKRKHIATALLDARLPAPARFIQHGARMWWRTWRKSLGSGRNSFPSVFPPKQRKRHARHDRRDPSAVRSSSRQPQQGDRRFRGRFDLVRRRLGPAARGGAPARAGRLHPGVARRVVHSLPAMLRFRMFAIACGYEDADDCDALRAAPLFKLAVGRAPESGRDLCSQPTMSRLEAAPPAAITLDIDDTCDAVHGLPPRTGGGPPAADAVQRPLRHALLPAGARLPCRERQAGGGPPAPRLTFRGDSHYGRTEAMAWCEANGVDYIFGLAGNAALHRLAYGVADDVRVRRAEAGAERLRGSASFDYAAGSWDRERRVVARLEATPRATSSLRAPARPAISTKGPTAPAARPRTRSSSTRPSSPPAAPPARARPPTSSGWCSTPPPTG